MPDEASVKQREHREKHRGKRKGWIALFSVILLGIIAFVLLSKKTKHEEAGKAQPAHAAGHPVPVVTGTAHSGDIAIYIEALGIVTPVYTVNVISRVQGQITQVNYREGQMVRAGDPLVEIDPRPYQAALTQAQGQLARDLGLLKEARIDLSRYRRAYAHNAIPKQQLDDQEQVVVQDEGTVKADQGALATAQVNLAYCHITSPIGGRVGLRLVDPGNMVQANSTTSLVVVAQLRPITVVFSVSEDHLPQILKQLRQGHAMQVEAFDRTQEKKLATGTLLTLDNLVDTTTGTVKLKAEFPNTDGELFPNQFVNARLKVETEKDKILVSTPAIQHNAQEAFVYVIKPDQTAEVRPVKTGATDGNSTVVTEGLKAGEVIAVDGFEKLQEGAKVKARHELAGTQGSPSEAP